MAGLQGRVIAGYQLADRLGDAGIAEVYRAHSTTPGGREVVVKVIYPEFVQQEGFRARFDYIVQAAARLRHPHILPLLGSGDQNGYLFLITPYVTAGTLRDWLRSGRRLGAHDIAPFSRQLCEAVTYAHSQGVIHGNIKPSNIFLHEGRHVLLGDFGRLWDISQLDMTHGGPGMEAVEFLAPEAFHGQAGQPSDIYSVGAVLYVGLTGRAPYTGSTPSEILNKHRSSPVPHLAQVAAALPANLAPLDSVVQRAMAKAPEQRFPSALELAQAIETTVRGAPRTGASISAAPFAGAMGGGAAALDGAPLSQFGSVPLGGADSRMPFGAPPPTGFAAPGSPPLVAPSSGIGQGGMPPSMAGAVSPPSVFSPAGQPGQASQALLGKASFPPTPLSGLVDPDMEEGRGGTATGAYQAVRLDPRAPPPLPGQPPLHAAGRPAALSGDALGDLAMQSTMRVSASPNVADGIAAPGAGASALTGDAQRQPVVRAAGSAAAPSAPAQRGRYASPAEAAPEPGASAPAQPPGRAAGGFMVAGGDAHWPPATGDGTAEAAALEDVDILYGPESDRLSDWSGPGSSSFDRASQSDLLDRPSSGTRDDRPFSATRLGLPRLTMPELEEMPVSWQDIAAGAPSAASRTPYPGDDAPANEPPDRWGSSTGWSEPPDRWGPSTDWSEDVVRSGEGGSWADDAEYSQSYDAVNGWSAESPAQESVPDLFASSSLMAADVAPQERSRSGRRPRGIKTGQPLVRRFGRPTKSEGPALDEEDPSDPFADPSAWARPSDAGFVSGRAGRGRPVRYREPRIQKPRRMRPLVTLFLLLVLLDGGLLVLARPDLCPRNACVALHSVLSRYLPGANTHGRPPAPSPLTASPAQVSLRTTPGGSANATLALTNTGKAAAAWKVSSDLSWLTVSNAASPLAPGAQVNVTLTAKPGSSLKPGTYAAKVDFTVGDTTLTVPVTVTVAHG